VRAAIFTLLFVSYAYFYEAGGWNQNSRFDLVRAVTNDHALRIDPYEKNTGDKALYDGHYYSDKAPGLALAAVPIVAAGRLALLATGGDPESFPGLAFLSYLATVFTVGLLTALAGVVLYDLAIELGADAGGALFAATAFGLATPMWTHATLFQGHAVAAAGLLFAFAATARIGPGRSIRANVGLAVLAGLSAGWATVSEFPAAVPAALIALWACTRAWSLGREHASRIIAALAVSALACAAVLMAYQYACFGSPFHLAYSSEEGFEGMKQGWFGINMPRLIRLRRILFSDYRGLLPLAPLLALAPVGLAVIGRRARGAALISTLIAIFYVLLNASYTYWEGGWSFGPRHVGPAIPFMCLWLAGLWTITPRVLRLGLLALWVWGASLSLLAVATMAQPPASYRHPITELLWPAFREGDLALTTQTFAHGSTDPGVWRAHTEPKAAWNLGMKMGLSGLVSLAPLALAWIGCGVWISVAGRSRRRSARSSASADAPASPARP
jgi:hypothetical protein